MTAQIAVTGSSGVVGGSVARRLATAGVPMRLVVRSADRAPALPASEVAEAAYGDTPATLAALDGIETLFMVSAAESATRRADHLQFVDDAAAAGVRRILYLSFYRAAEDSTFLLGRDHWHTEQRIRSKGIAFTFLRDSLYADFLLPMAGDDGVLRGPAGDGRLAAVSRADVADVATVVLRDAWTAARDGDGSFAGTAHDGQSYELTGPESLTLSEVAAVLSDVTGRPFSYQRETIEEAYASRARYGAPDWMVDAWVSTYTAIAAGELADVTGDVERVAGHPPLSLAEVVAAAAR